MNAAATRPVLVAYATRQGSTGGVAERIADSLRTGGLVVELRRVDEVERVRDCAAVVLGSPVYNGRWLPEADAFVQDQLQPLPDRPVWLFSVGTFGDRKRVLGRLMTREPRGIQGIRGATGARDYRVFAGVISPGSWPLAGRLFLWALGGRLGDNRDWSEIDAWSQDILRTLRDGDVPDPRPAQGGPRATIAS